MNGPEHYREAERLLDDMPTVRDWVEAPEDAAEHSRATVAQAQAHATLALAAATALPAVRRYYGDDSDADSQWGRVIS